MPTAVVNGKPMRFASVEVRECDCVLCNHGGGDAPERKAPAFTVGETRREWDKLVTPVVLHLDRWPLSAVVK